MSVTLFRSLKRFNFGHMSYVLIHLNKSRLLIYTRVKVDQWRPITLMLYSYANEMITLKTALFSTAPKPRQIVLQKLLRAKLQPTTWVTSHSCLPSMIGTSAWCKIPRFETNHESIHRNSTVFQRRFDSNRTEVVTCLTDTSVTCHKNRTKSNQMKNPMHIRSYKYLTPSSYRTTNNKNSN